MLYQKIAGPFKRDMTTNKVIPGAWTSPELEALADTPIWFATEKIDGTNMRVMWDGYRVTVGGRTERSELHKQLVDTMTEMFPEEKFEQTFGEKPVTIFGEGYGAGIQNGGKYSTEKSFAMFDVAVNGKYLRSQDVLNLGYSWDIKHAPLLLDDATLHEVISRVKNGLQSGYGSFNAEGMVAKTNLGLLDHRGDRIIVKVKDVDFR